MLPDDTICYCYNVSLRKLVHFARRECPSHASQMTQCLGAGTGCGWCIPFLKNIAQAPDDFAALEIGPEDYARQRTTYIGTKQPKNQF